MKHGLHSLGALVLLGGIVVAGSALAGDPLPTAPTVLKKKGVIQKKILGVVLVCLPWGGFQFMQKIVEIKNTTTKTMPTGHKIYWNASDGDKGEITLAKNLPAGEETTGFGTTRASKFGYTCTAYTSSF